MTAGKVERRIAIVGAGAIGLLYAGLLGRAAAAAGGPDLPAPVLITRRPELHAAARRGITVLRADGARLLCPGVDARLGSAPGSGDCVLALITVAAYDTAWAARVAAGLLRADGIAITLQNGLDNRAVLAEVLGEDRALQGATSFATSAPELAVAQLASSGATWLPTLPARLDWLPGVLTAAGLEPLHVADADQLAWHKIAIGLNGYLCLALAKPLGQVVTSAAARALVLRAAHEVLDVAAACGVHLDRAGIGPALEKSWGACTPTSLSSMYADYLAGKHTELDERLGGVLRRAATQDVAVPTLRALHDLARTRLELEGRA